MSHMKSISRFGLPALCGGVMVAFFGVVPGPARPVQAAFVEQGKGGPQLLATSLFKLVRRRTRPSTAPTPSKAGRAMTLSLD